MKVIISLLFLTVVASVTAIPTPNSGLGGLLSGVGDLLSHLLGVGHRSKTDSFSSPESDQDIPQTYSEEIHERQKITIPKHQVCATSAAQFPSGDANEIDKFLGEATNCLLSNSLNVLDSLVDDADAYAIKLSQTALDRNRDAGLKENVLKKFQDTNTNINTEQDALFTSLIDVINVALSKIAATPNMTQARLNQYYNTINDDFQDSVKSVKELVGLIETYIVKTIGKGIVDFLRSAHASNAKVKSAVHEINKYVNSIDGQIYAVVKSNNDNAKKHLI